MNRKGRILLFLILGFSLNIFSQSAENEIVNIEFGKPVSLTEGERTILVPNVKGNKLDGNRPNFFMKKGVNANDIEIDFVKILSTEPAISEEINYLMAQNIDISAFSYSARISNLDGNNIFILNLLPFIEEEGQVKRIKQVEIRFKKELIDNSSLKSYKANSALSDGTGYWYKISVTKDGVYKIDKDFLQAFGIDVTTLNPQHINIYGNGDGRLSEINGSLRTDDIEKNAIFIQGEDDGIFDDQDYILFYAWGPDRWYQNSDTSFIRDKHIYSNVSCYFININSQETPLRITNAIQSTGVPTHTVSSYSYSDIYENDLVNLMSGGQRWYGDLFDTELVKTFTFNVPGIISSEPAYFNVAIGTNAKSPGGTAQTYSVGGTVLNTSTLPSAEDWARSTKEMTFNNPASSIPFKISITRNSPDVLTYLDFILLNARCSISLQSPQFNFRDINSVGVGNISEFTISNMQTDCFVWEVTDRHKPARINGILSGSDYSFVVTSDSLREFVVSDGLTFLTPNRIGVVASQNLHGLPQADMLIITHPNFISQADRLAKLHEADGLSVHVVTTSQVFNEFSSGMQDATAFRAFAKMFYDRATNENEKPEYLLLFGDGTYDPKDRVENNNNYVLTYQMLNSESHIASTPTDDYFGILEDGAGISSSDVMNIGVGRLLISNQEMAKQQVDKIEHYMRNGSSLFTSSNNCCDGIASTTTFGDWRTKYVQIADDEENGYFVKFNTEPAYKYVKDSFPDMNGDKIYLDAFQQITTAGGHRYPDAVNAINDRIDRGALVVNYVGHGGEVGVAEERVITVPQIQGWDNINALTLLVSATCEFTKFDDPDRVSAGEWASINPNGAAIALMTTTRAIFFGTNGDIVEEFFKNVYERDDDHLPLTFGEIFRRTKNEVPGDNKRSFVLIGDPALRIALPRMKVVTDSINGLSPTVEMDTINALSKVTIKGHLVDFDDNILSNFNGVLSPTILDKAKTLYTLGNDPTSPIIPFELQTNRVYKGKASVINGYFEFSFIVPKDINYAIDFGKISYYAENGSFDAIGFDTSFYIGGINPDGLDDNTGPEVDLYLNNENFVNGGITDDSPVLIAKVYDENGINTVGNGVGHDIVAILDGETGNPYVLNDYYTADLDSYQSGEIQYSFEGLDPGNHTLSLKVWDVNNNSTEVSLNFVVQEQTDIALDHVLNYPNPFTTHTEFYFEHNQVCSSLETQIQIFTVTGKLVKTMNQTINTSGFRSDGIAWDGKDDFGDQLAKGVYVYRLLVRNPEGDVAEKLEKLMILR